MKKVNKVVASSLGIIITMPQYSEEAFLEGGRAVEGVWIEQIWPMYLSANFTVNFSSCTINSWKGKIRKILSGRIGETAALFQHITPQLNNKQAVFMFRLVKGGKPNIRSLRRTIESSFIY